MTISLFSGQGSQYTGMGLDLAAADPSLEAIYETASSVLGFDLKKIIGESDAETLSRTIYAQPAIMATSLVCLEAAKKKGFSFGGVAGHSLGEYAAMVASGMLSMEDGFRVIKARAAAMDKVAQTAGGAMCAILKLSAADVERICEETEGYVVPANYNSSIQTVIAGEKAAVSAAAEAAAALKGRAVPLAVASAFHTKMMQPAADEFYQAVKDVTFKTPEVKFFSNVLGAELTDFSDMPSLLAKHIVSPVRFTAELAQMQEQGFDTFVEFGPKNVLTGLVKKTLKGVTALNCEGCTTLEEVVSL
ncbi:MAG: ACP S-malonyltransferase [Ruminococcus sp.]|nr:ACP S-malonyltransferase [Ruminococcus sp.]